MFRKSVHQYVLYVLYTYLYVVHPIILYTYILYRTALYTLWCMTYTSFVVP